MKRIIIISLLFIFYLCAMEEESSLMDNKLEEYLYFICKAANAETKLEEKEEELKNEKKRWKDEKAILKEQIFKSKQKNVLKEAEFHKKIRKEKKELYHTGKVVDIYKEREELLLDYIARLEQKLEGKNDPFEAARKAIGIDMPILPIKLYEYKQQCMQKLDTEVKNALEAVKVEFSLNPVWDRYLERCQELIDFDNLLKIDCSRTDMHMQINVKDCKMLRLIKEILLGYGININNVEIVLANSKTTSSAGSVNQRVSNDKIYHSMTFKNKLLKKRCSTLERKAIIHHEVNHLLNYDAMRENQLLCFLRDLGFDKDKIENAKSIINFRHAKEFRADLSFAVNHPELIVGLQEFLNRLMKKQDQCNQELWKTHPPTIQRIEQLNLVKQFLAPHYSF